MWWLRSSVPWWPHLWDCWWGSESIQVTSQSDLEILSLLTSCWRHQFYNRFFSEPPLTERFCFISSFYCSWHKNQWFFHFDQRWICKKCVSFGETQLSCTSLSDFVYIISWTSPNSRWKIGDSNLGQHYQGWGQILWIVFKLKYKYFLRCSIAIIKTNTFELHFNYSRWSVTWKNRSHLTNISSLKVLSFEQYLLD